MICRVSNANAERIRDMEHQVTHNPLGCEPVGKLMTKFAVPSIIAMIVGALYNIVDQLFIGQAVGTLGNAATNIAFPLSTICLSLALLFGIGGASSFNLSMGKGDRQAAGYYVGNAVVMLVLCGVIICFFAEIFMTPMLLLFGSPADVLPYAEEYVRITALGFPMLLLTIGGGHLIRADGSPRMAMFCNLSGAIINTILDAWFVMVLDMGMAGAALATIIGQIFSGIVVIVYLCHYKTVKLEPRHLKIHWNYLARVAAIGTASFFNQLAIMLVQVVMNNLLKHYGENSVYGASIPIAAAGIAVKVSQVFFSVVIGLSQGSQPIESFNYGAKQYDRVKKAYYLALGAGAAISVVGFLLFQICPRQILAMFGSGSPEYYAFGVKLFRIYLLGTIVNFLQPITSTFFTSIGKPVKGTFLSLTRQILFLLPLMVVLPIFFGIDGILYAGPVSDGMAAVVTVIMAMLEWKQMNAEAKKC